MHNLETVLYGIAGLGLGLGIAGSTNKLKIIGWIACAVGFGLMQYFGFKL
jgi:hypothetical protein